MSSGPGSGTRDLFDELAGLAVLLAVGDEEVLEPDDAPLVAPPQGDLGAKRDEGRRSVADRRTVGDVAAERAHVAYLLAADPQPEGFEFGQVRGDDRPRLGIGGGGAEDQRILGDPHPLEVGDVADEHRRGNVAHELGDPQPDVGHAGDDARLGPARQHLGQRIGARWNDDGVADLDIGPVGEFG